MSKIIRNWTHEPLAKRIWSHACNSSLQNHAYSPLPCFLHRDFIQIDPHFPWFNMGNWWCSRCKSPVKLRLSSNFPRIFPSTNIPSDSDPQRKHRKYHRPNSNAWRLKERRFWWCRKNPESLIEFFESLAFWWRDEARSCFYAFPNSWYIFEAFSRPSQILVVPLQKT